MARRDNNAGRGRTVGDNNAPLGRTVTDNERTVSDNSADNIAVDAAWVIMPSVQEVTRRGRQETVGFPDGRHSWGFDRDVVPENPPENQRQLGLLIESFSDAQWVVISTGAPRAWVIEPLSLTVRPLSANVRPRGWLLSRNVRPLMPLLSRPAD
jgi:hypothetical protein